MVLLFIKIVLLYTLEIVILEVAGDRVKILAFRISQVPNEYFGPIVYSTAPIDEETTGLTLTLPVKKIIHRNVLMKINLNYNKIPVIKELVMTFCDALNNPKILKPLVNKLEPYMENPKSCPLPIGDWQLKDYALEAQNHCPFGIAPSGGYEVELDIGTSVNDPFIKVVAAGNVRNIHDPFFGFGSWFNPANFF